LSNSPARRTALNRCDGVFSPQNRWWEAKRHYCVEPLSRYGYPFRLRHCLLIDLL
jgi:hypothetical protein